MLRLTLPAAALHHISAHSPSTLTSTATNSADHSIITATSVPTDYAYSSFDPLVQSNQVFISLVNPVDIVEGAITTCSSHQSSNATTPAIPWYHSYHPYPMPLHASIGGSTSTGYV